MSKNKIIAVGTDVSKGKNIVVARRPDGEIVISRSLFYIQQNNWQDSRIRSEVSVARFV